MTGREARRLCDEGRIRQLGESGKVWQLTEDSFAHPNHETGDGRISLEVSSYLQEFMASEMRQRPSWWIEENRLY